MNDDRIVWVDDYYDREFASDGVSRFGAYVQQRAHLFVDDLDSLSPAGFAAAVWRIGSSPVMSPGYVRTRPDVWGVTCCRGEDPSVLVADVEARLPWPDGWAHSPSAIGWTGWARSDTTWDEPPLLLPPEDKKHALLVTAHLRVPIDADLLPTPRKGRSWDVMVAKRAVATLVGQVNAHAGPLLAELRERAGAGVRR